MTMNTKVTLLTELVTRTRVLDAAVEPTDAGHLVTIRARREGERHDRKYQFCVGVHERDEADKMALAVFLPSFERGLPDLIQNGIWFEVQ